MGRKKKSKKPSNKELISRRSLFYSICIFALFQFLLIPLQRQSYTIFWIVSAAGYMVVLLELFYSRVSDKPLRIKFKFVRKRVWQKHFIRHLVLPTLLYLSGVVFLFFNRVKVLDQIAILILSTSFWMLLFNISMTYLKAYRVSKKTRYIFDVIRIVIFYFMTDIVINGVFYYGLNTFFIYLGVGLLSFILVTLMLSIYQQFSSKIWVYNLLSSVLIAIAALFLISLSVFNIAILSLVITVVFYLVVVFWHHKLEGTLNWDVMTQYILFAIMAVILLLYL